MVRNENKNGEMRIAPCCCDIGTSCEELCQSLNQALQNVDEETHVAINRESLDDVHFLTTENAASGQQ